MQKKITLEEASALVKKNKALSEIPVRTIIHHESFEFRVIGRNHDLCAECTWLPTTTVIGKHIVGTHYFHEYACQSGWSGSDIRKWLNDTVFNSLPSSLRSFIHPAMRTTYGSDGRAYRTDDYLFIPTESEVFGSAIYSGQMAGEKYEGFETKKDRHFVDRAGWPYGIWLASPVPDEPENFCYCSTVPANSRVGSETIGVPLCFIIA